MHSVLTTFYIVKPKKSDKVLYQEDFMDLFDSKDSLIILSQNISWSKIENNLCKYYIGIG